MAAKSEKPLKTGEVLSKAGISRQVLYRYIQMDLIEPAEVTETDITTHGFRRRNWLANCTNCVTVMFPIS